MTINIKKLQKLAQLSADQAAVSLNKLTGIPTHIEIFNVQVGKLHHKFENIASDSYVTGIYLPVRGAVDGSALFVIPKDISLKLAQLLTKQENSSQHGFDELEVSALKEVTNIVCGSFLTNMSNMLHIQVIEHLPIFIFDTLSTVLNQTRESAGENEDEVLLIEIQFKLDAVSVPGYIILVLSFSQMEIIKKALDKIQM